MSEKNDTQVINSERKREKLYFRLSAGSSGSMRFIFPLFKELTRHRYHGLYVIGKI